MKKRKFLVISAGDPAGIGPEVVLKSLDRLKFQYPIIVVGSRNAFEKVKRVAENVVMPIAHSVEDVFRTFQFPVLFEPEETNIEFKLGSPSEDTGRVAFTFFKKAVEIAMSLENTALITAPLSKFWVSKAVGEFSGHTDYLRKITNCSNATMLFYSKKMVVSLVTEHIPLREVPKRITTESVFNAIKNTAEFLKLIGREGTISVCGLNPHAGEGGTLGSEEVVIQKAIDTASEFYEVAGPIPADTAFWKLKKKDFSAVVCMYHDQGLGPFKMLHFYDGVNVTAGLPFIRTSPDHGTAYEIAGKGVADFRSMFEAIKLARKLLKRKEKLKG